MKRWHALISAPAHTPGEHKKDNVHQQHQPPADTGALQSANTANAEKGSLLEPSIRITNLKQKLHLIRKNAKSNFNLEAMSDLVEEARFNKSAIVNDESAAQELIALLGMSPATRRAVHLREITEFGRKIDFPVSWHGTERFRAIIWYHSLQQLKLAEFKAGDVITRTDQPGSCAYWLLSGDAVVRTDDAMAAQQQAAAAVAAAEEAAAREAAAALAAAQANMHSPSWRSIGNADASGLSTRQPSRHRSNSIRATDMPHARSLQRDTSITSKASRRVSPRSQQPSLTQIPHSPGLQATHSSSTEGQDVVQVTRRSGTAQSSSTQTTQGATTRHVQINLESPGRTSSTMSPSQAGHLSHRARSQQLTGTNTMSGKASMQFQSAELGPFVSAEILDPCTGDTELGLWDLFGEDALQASPYKSNVIAMTDVVCACLSMDEYQQSVNRLAGETFESLKAIEVLLKDRATRTSQELADLADQLSVFGMFKTMEPAMRLEVCNIVEYLYCPAGFTLFEEGDRVDFCYVLLEGQVAFTKFDDRTRRLEDLGTKNTGDHFGTLLTLSAGEKKRPFTAMTTRPCELAVISRVGYNRILKQQLQGAIQARVNLLQGLAIMKSSTITALQKVAIHCQDEVFPAGSVIVDPSCAPNRIFFIAEGEAKLVWVTDHPSKLPEEQSDAKQKTKDTPSHSSGDAASSAAAEKARETTLTVNQQLGSTTFAASPKMANGKQKHTIELARLAKGDVINGITLVNTAPLFHVMAASQMKLISFEADSVEAILGRESCQLLKDLVVSSHNWAKKRLKRVVGVRQAVGEHIMDASAHRELSDKDLQYFTDHYVPPGVWELAEQQLAQAGPGHVLSSSHGGIVARSGQAGLQVAGVRSMEDVLRLPAATVKGAKHKEPLRPRKSSMPGAAHSNGGSVAELWPQPSSALSQQASYASLGPVSHSEAAVAGQASSVSVGTTISQAANAAQLAGLTGKDQQHLGTVVGVGATARKKKNRHMAFAGGVSTAILDLTTEPTLQCSLVAQTSCAELEPVEPVQAQPIEKVLIQLPSLPAANNPAAAAQDATEPPSPGASPMSPHARQTLGMSSSIRSGRDKSPGSMSPRDALKGSRMAGGWETQNSEAALRSELDHEVASIMSTMPFSAVQCAPKHSAVSEPLQLDGTVLQQVSIASIVSQQPSSLHCNQRANPFARQSRSHSPSVQLPGTHHAVGPSMHSHLPRIANAQSPVLASPALPNKVILQRPCSPKTAQYSYKRSAAIVSAHVRPDGTINLREHSLNAIASESDVTSVQQQARMRQWARTPQPMVDDMMLISEPSVVIMPHMMNVYQSVLTSEKSLMPPLGLHRRRSSSPPKPKWTIAAQPQSQVQGPGLSAPGGRGTTAQGKAVPTNVMPFSDDRSQAGSSDSDSEQGQQQHPSISLKTIAVSLRALTQTDKPPPMTSRMLGRRSSTAASRRSNSMRSPETPFQDSVVRLIATSREHEPSLPLDTDVTAPPLRDHKLSQPTLSDLNYIIHRWGHRWASEREELLHQRFLQGSTLPLGLTPRTLDRVQDTEEATNWVKHFQKQLSVLENFGAPVPASPGRQRHS